MDIVYATPEESKVSNEEFLKRAEALRRQIKATGAKSSEGAYIKDGQVRSFVNG
jgi:hypothetical protein